MTVEDYINKEMPMIRRVVYRVANKFNIEFEDLLQETLLRAWMKNDVYDDTMGYGGFCLWLRRIAWNHAIDKWRWEMRSFMDLKFAEDKLRVEQDLKFIRTDIAQYYHALRKNFHTRKAMYLYLHTQGYKMKDIADCDNLTEEKIKDIFFVLRTYLRRHRLSPA